jgi:serine/threonine protein kinase/WD40 repeat protein
MTAKKSNPEEIFNKAIDISNPTEQLDYLDKACAGDEKLRAEVEFLLESHQKAGSFLESPPIDPDVTLDEAPLTEGPETVIGRYKLLEKIGEGGMASVYMAEQKRPIRRRVALKIIKLGMDTKQVIARFEAERQALAMMDHPNIARVLDAGTTETGRPYFVMELVRGVAITEYCDKNNLSTRERLELFVSVCQSVQHAHQKGIIHRDIKPSNVMVTLHDGQPVVKVIDFGIAKAVNQQLTEKTVFTRYSQMIGTPEYMSPEQAEMSGLDIDTRTDVFSLGVLLYELLTGTTPFDSDYLLRKGYGEMQRIIREEEPIRPSTKISTLGETITDVAKHRQTSPELLCKLIRSDLDWIVMKTMEKDRSRRYESVSEFAADIKRHLDNEPVLAGRPSRVYRMQKFVKRNKTLCISSVAVASILVLAVMISSHQAWVAQIARKAESDARNTAETERDRAKEAESRAQENLYNSLVREARATRFARAPGYRDDVFGVLKQARDLNIPQKDLADLRTEAIACMGDYIGLEPTDVVKFPQGLNTGIWSAVHHPTDPIAAFGLLEGTVILKDLQSAKEIARFDCGHFCSSVNFASTGKTLLSVHIPSGDHFWDLQFDKAVAHLFICAQDGTWIQSKTISIPYAAYGMSVDSGFMIGVIDSPSRPAHLLEPITGNIIREFDFHVDMNDLPALTVSIDGRFVALGNVESTSSDKPILDIWDLKEDKHLKRLKPNLAKCTCLRFSPDRRYLAFLSTSGAYIYSTETWEVVGHIAEPFFRLADALFLPHSTVFVFSRGTRFYLWDFEKKEYLATIEQSLGGTTKFSASADGRSLITYDHKQAWLYSLDAVDERLVISGHTASVPGIAFNPDGSRLASVSKDRRLRIWNSFTGHLEMVKELEGQGQSVSYSKDGKYIVTTDHDRDRVCIWSTETTDRLCKLGSERKSQTWSAELTDDNRYLVTATAQSETGEGAITVWNCTIDALGGVETRFEVKQLKSFSGDILDVILAPNNHHLAFVRLEDWSVPLELYQWNLTDTHNPRLLTKDLCGCGAQTIEFTPDGSQILAVDANRFVVTYDVQSGQKTTSFQTLGTDHIGNWGRDIMHKLSPDGTILAIGSPSNHGVDLWNPENGCLLYSLPDQDGEIYYFAWSPDNKRLAVSRSNGEVDIWNIAKIENILTELKLHPVMNSK